MATGVLPSDLFAERELLGSILIDPDATLPEILGMGVLESDIYTPEHTPVFRAMVAIYNEGRTITPASIASWLSSRENWLEEAGGPEGINSLRDDAGDFRDAATRVMRQGVRRELMVFGAHVNVQAMNEGVQVDVMLDRLEERLLSIRRRQAVSVLPIGSFIDDYREQFDRRRAGDISDLVRFGVPYVDDALGALESNDFLIMAGRPGDGKSTWLKWLMYNMAILPAQENRQGIYLADYEEGKSQVVMKLVAVITGLSTKLLINPANMTDDQAGQVYDAINVIRNAPIFIESVSGQTPWQYKARVTEAKRRCMADFGVELKVHSPDYIQRMQYPGESGNTAHTLISNAVRDMCMENQLNTPCVATAQLSRAPVSNGRPREYNLSDLRESGTYEQDGTAIAFVSRPWMLNPPSISDIRMFHENIMANGQVNPEWQVEPVRLLIAKNRRGGTGKTKTLAWHRYCGRFMEDERLEQEA